MCQFCASVCSKLEVGISPHLICGSLSVNIYLQCASHLTMEEKVQQHVCINFCFRLGKSGAETYELLQAAFGQSCLSRSKTIEWYCHFKSGTWHHLLDRRKRGRWSPMSRPCWLRSSTLTGWFAMSTFLEDRQYIRNSRKQSCNASTTLCADIALRSGAPAIGSCTMTVLLPTGLSPQMNFWQNTTFCRPHTLPTPLTLLRVTSSSSRSWRKQWKVADLITLKRFKPARQLRAIKKSDYRRCFRQWQECWNKCIQAQGHYFEGDKTN